jgi:hypothetical protein
MRRSPEPGGLMLASELRDERFHDPDHFVIQAADVDGSLISSL